MSSFFPLPPPAHSFFIGPTVINIQVNGSDQHALVNAGGEKDVSKEVGEEERGARLPLMCTKIV